MAIWLHAGSPDKPGAARHQLFAVGRPQNGVVTLSAQDRRDLAEGRLLVRFYVESVKGSSGDVPVRFERR